MSSEHGGKSREGVLCVFLGTSCWRTTPVVVRAGVHKVSFLYPPTRSKLLIHCRHALTTFMPSAFGYSTLGVWGCHTRECTFRRVKNSSETWTLADPGSVYTGRGGSLGNPLSPPTNLYIHRSYPSSKHSKWFSTEEQERDQPFDWDAWPTA